MHASTGALRLKNEVEKKEQKSCPWFGKEDMLEPWHKSSLWKEDNGGWSASDPDSLDSPKPSSFVFFGPHQEVEEYNGPPLPDAVQSRFQQCVEKGFLLVWFGYALFLLTNWWTHD